MQWLERKILSFNSAGQRDALVAAVHRLRPPGHGMQTHGTAFSAFLSILQPALMQHVRLQLLQGITESHCEDYQSILGHSSKLSGCTVPSFLDEPPNLPM